MAVKERQLIPLVLSSLFAFHIGSNLAIHRDQPFEQQLHPEESFAEVGLSSTTKPDDLKLTVGTFNVLAQMKFGLDPQGFMCATENALSEHQPHNATSGRISSDNNTWITKKLKELMVPGGGSPEIDILALQEVDFAMFSGIEAFVAQNRDFSWQALDGKPGRSMTTTEAQQMNQEERVAYRNGSKLAQKVNDPAYVVFNNAKVNLTECKPTHDPNVKSGALCTFSGQQGGSLTALLMHVTSTGLGDSTFKQIIADAARVELEKVDELKVDVVAGDLNCEQEKAKTAAEGLDHLQLVEFNETQRNVSLFGSVHRGVFDYRKLAQMIAGSENFGLLRNIFLKSSLNISGGQPLTCNNVTQLCAYEELKTSPDCKKGVDLCNAPDGKLRQESDKLGFNLTTGNLLTLVQAMGFGDNDFTFKTKDPKNQPTCSIEHKTEDFIFARNAPATSRANIWHMEKVLENPPWPSEDFPSDHLPVYAEITIPAETTA